MKRSFRVLVVEDDHQDAATLIAYLARASVKVAVACATRLSAALQLLRAELFDVVLLDLGLPDADGNTALLKIREAHPDTPVVVLTGNDASFGEEVIAFGAEDFLPKPRLDEDKLIRTVRHAVARSDSARRLRAAVDRNVDAILIIRARDSVILYANAAAAALFEKDTSELVGETFGFPMGAAGPPEIDIVGSANRSAEMRVTELTWDDEPAYLASLRDITDRRRAEDLQRRLVHADRLAAIGVLAAGVAHEVNNPAQYILENMIELERAMDSMDRFMKEVHEREGMSDAATEMKQLLDAHGVGALVGHLRGVAQDNRAGVERIVEIVRDLRTFARSEPERLELVDVNDTVQMACNMTANQLRHRAELIIELTPAPPIVADRGKLCQVFTNLLVNAAHAIEDGGKANYVRVTSTVANDEIHVSVEDTGGGIPGHLRARIFEPFFTTKARETGTGLGLSLTADIVRQHGGTIEIVSGPHEATRFLVTLPTQSALTLPPALPRPVSNYPVPARSRVLVIDDEVPLLKALSRMIRERHDVVSALGGEEALRVLATDSAFDAVICDLMMPQVDGRQVFEFLKLRAPHLCSRVVFFSGGAFTKRTREFLSTMVNPMVRKPVERETLLRIIDGVITDHAQPSSSV